MTLEGKLLAVFLMAAVTYLIRALPITIFRKEIKNTFVKSFLFYVPYAVLAAMVLPDILFSTAGIGSAVAGLAVALVLSWLNKGLLTVALGAAAAVFVFERIVQAIL